MRQGQRPEPVSLDEAAAYEFSPMEREFVASRQRRQAIGRPAEVDAMLESLLESTKADELILAPQSATVESRIRSLEIAAGLTALAATPAAAG